ncbi:MAG: hypothetical protein ACRDIF_00265, partial [Actinomycetota bacterium]
MLILTSLAVVALLAPASSEELLLRIREARILAEEGTSSPSPSKMDEVRAALALPAVVEVGSDRIAMASEPLLDRLRGTGAGEFRQAIAHLDALEITVRETVNASRIDPERTRRALRRAYTGIQPRPPLIQMLKRGAAERLASLARWLLERLVQLRSPAVSWVVLLSALGVAVLLLRRLRFVPERVVRRGEEASRDEPDWGALVEDALARGDLPKAARAAYRALLATLARRGLVTDAPSLTAGECRR